MAKVCLDAGHYATYNTSPANKLYVESLRMWDLHLLLKKYLEQLGITVYTTRSEQHRDLSLTTRGKLSAGCDLFISLHSNAVGSRVDESVDYVVSYCQYDDRGISIDDISRDFGLKLAKTVASVMGTKQEPRIGTRRSDSDKDHDGILDDNYYGVLNGARQVGVPGVIIEHSFHTNTRSTNWLLDNNNLDRLARAEAECIASYLLKKTVTLSDYSLQDAQNALKESLKINANSGKYDVDGDGVVELSDAQSVLKKALKIDGANHSNVTELPTPAPSVQPKPVTSSYVVGKTYTLVADGLRIRKSPNGQILTYNQLSANAKKNAYPSGTLKKGTRVTCKDVSVVSGNTWIKIPSGWICAVNNGKVYVS